MRTAPPKGMSYQRFDDRLVITRRWFKTGTHLSLAGAGLFVVIFFIFPAIKDNTSTRAVFFTPPFWIALYLFGSALYGAVNKTVITVNPGKLSIEHGPLPWPGNKRLSTDEIKQLFGKEVARKKKHGIEYTYDIYVIFKGGKREKLVKGLHTLAQAQFLERQLENYLRIPNYPVYDEVGSSSRRGSKRMVVPWKALEKSHGLRVFAASDEDTVRASGIYRGYLLLCETLKKGWGDEIHTRLIVSTDPFAEGKPDGDAPTVEMVARLFDFSLSNYDPQGTITIESDAQSLQYEVKGIDVDANYLKFLIDRFCNLLDAYPRIALLGGEVVPALLGVTDQEAHPLHAVASRLLQDVVQETTTRLSRGSDKLLCPTCLVHCAPRKINIKQLNDAYYYGCRQCGQSLEFLTVTNPIIAVLDRGMDAKTVAENGEFRANWLLHRQIFDFEAVEIVRAGDEDVERFAVQVGNDTDPARKPHYPQMQCAVSPACNLSENTIRILRRTFGQVTGLKSAEGDAK